MNNKYDNLLFIDEAALIINLIENNELQTKFLQFSLDSMTTYNKNKDENSK